MIENMDDLYKNLAGYEDLEDLDRKVFQELVDAGFRAVKVERMKCEVNTSVIGRIGPFRCTRAWNYWRVMGPMPLAIADLIHDGKAYHGIRAGGHCSNPEPVTQSISLACSGKEAISKEEFVVLKPIENRFAHNGKLVIPLDMRYVVDSEDRSRSPFVTLYHIDTASGMKKFATVASALVSFATHSLEA